MRTVYLTENDKYNAVVTQMLKKSGKTQKDLSKYLGVHYNTVQKKLSGINDWTFTEMQKTARFFGRSVKELVL